jgi:NADH dehydrogenase
MWQIATRQRTALLITGRPDQHIGVDVGLFRAQLEDREPDERLAGPDAETTQASGDQPAAAA